MCADRIETAKWLPNFQQAGSGSEKLVLSLAISEYDHVRDLIEGHVPVQGAKIIGLSLPIEEIFFRFIKFREWEISEMSFAKFVSLVSQGERSITAIPVFPSRVFRHSSIYVRRGSNVRTPADLVGAKVGLPEWAQTAAIYSRGFLVNQFGLRLQDIEWIQSGVNQPGRHEKVGLKLPKGQSLTPRPETSLNEMLLRGEIDAVLSAHAPAAFEAGNPEIVRMFEDYRPIEEAYWRESGVFPIMHVIAIKTAVLERFPWVAGNLMTAFEEAKRRSLARFEEMTASRYPIPWGQDVARATKDRFGTDFWPYGIEPNRTTLETFLRYAYEQGVCHRLLEVEELFPEMVRSSFRV